MNPDAVVKQEMAKRGHTHEKITLVRGCPRCEFLMDKYGVKR